MSDLNKSDLQLLTRTIEDALSKGFRSLSSHSSQGRAAPSFQSESPREKSDRKKREKAQSDFDNRLDDLVKSQDKLFKATSRLTGTLSSNDKEMSAAQKDYTKAIENASRAVKANAHYDQLYRNGIVNQVRQAGLVTNTSRHLNDELAKTTLQTSLLAAAMIRQQETLEEGTAEYDAFVSKMSDAAADLADTFSDNGKTFRQLANSVTGNLNPRLFADFRASIGKAKSALHETMAGFGFNKLDDVMSEDGMRRTLNSKDGEGSKFRDALLASADVMKTMGVKIETATDGASTDFGALARELKVLNDKMSNTGSRMDKAVVASEGSKHSLTTQIKSSMFQKLSSSILGSSYALDKLKDTVRALSAVMQEAMVFNSKQIASSYIDSKSEKLRLGVSEEAWMKMLEENRGTIASNGIGGLGDIASSAKATFAKAGLVFEDNVGAVGAIIKNSQSLKIDQRDTNALGDYISQTTERFKRLSFIMGGSPEDFAKFNQQLLDSTDISDTLLGLNKQQAMVYAKGIGSQLEEITYRTRSAELAADIIKTQEAGRREKIQARYKSAAGIQLMAGMAGFDQNKANELARIKRLGIAATGDDRKRQAILEQELGAAYKAKMNSAQGMGDAGLGLANTLSIFGETLEGMLDGSTKTALDLGAKAQSNVDSNMSISSEEAKTKAAAAKGDETLANLANMFNSAQSLLGDKIVLAIGTATAAIVAAILLPKVAGKALEVGKKLVNGKGGIPDAPDADGAGKTAGKAAGKGGKLLKLGKLAGKGLAGATVGLAGDWAVDKLRGSGHDDAAAAASIGTSAATGAAMGSIIPGVGTAIGAAAGGLYGLWDNRDKVGQWGGAAADKVSAWGSAAGDYIGNKFSSLTQTKPPINSAATPAKINSTTSLTPAGTEGVKVKNFDEAVVTTLAQISANTAKTAELLQKILDASDPSKVPASGLSRSKTLPSTTAFISGGPR